MEIVAMGSRLRSTITNIFVNFHEESLCSCKKKPSGCVCCRYLLHLLQTESQCKNPYEKLNRLRPDTYFTAKRKKQQYTVDNSKTQGTNENFRVIEGASFQKLGKNKKHHAVKALESIFTPGHCYCTVLESHQ